MAKPGDLYIITVKENGTRWAVPIDIIARNRAQEFAHEFAGDVGRSLAEDTWPLFDEDDYNVHDWAANNMNWRDVEDYAILWKEIPILPNYQEAWVNGEYEIVTPPSMPRKSPTG